MTLDFIYFQLQRLFKDIITKEFVDQGHYLTGKSLESITTKQSGGKLEGFAVSYLKYLDEGIPPQKITWAMLPGLTQYFRLRGYSSEDAATFAYLTIQKWLIEGMPTQASAAYSRTGARTNFIEIAFQKNDSRIDNLFSVNMDAIVDEHYHKTKTETI